MMGGMMADMAGMRADMQDIHALLSKHESVERTVKQLPNGVETVTTSAEPEVIPMIQKHVRAMHKRLKEKRLIRPMDPLFVAIFENADKIEMSITDLPDGVKVVETSPDAYVVRLIQEHARSVDRFVAEGMEAMHKTTPAPQREAAAPDESSVGDRRDSREETTPQRDPAAADSPASAGPTPTLAPQVRWIGEMRNVHRKGDLTGHVDLRSLAKLPHLYAVGPVEGLRGEVTIADGAPLTSQVREGKVIVDRSFHHKACFLVYAQVEHWQELPVPETVKTAADLEQFVWQLASARLDVSQPFVFRLTGKPAIVDYHIVNKTDDLPHNPEQHEKVKFRLQLKDQPMEIVGFGSDQHQGVFTHHDSKLHMHVRTTDGSTGGHVDGLQLTGGLTLRLPKTE
jgi:acetolactate decarboxylase